MSNRPQQKKSKYVNLGAMIESKEKDEQGRPTYYIKFSSDSNILIDGINFAGKTIQVSRPTDKLERMVKAGKLSEDEFEKKAERYSPEGDLKFIKFELSAKIQ